MVKSSLIRPYFMTSTNIIMRSISLLSLFFVLLFSSGCKKESTSAKQKINIGALLSLTGNWSSLGLTSKAAVELAVADVNEYLLKTGSPFEFSSSTYDTKLDTTLALQFIKEAVGSGTKYFVGPQSSAELAATRSYAVANNVVVVSQGSTASSLSIANDPIFRFCPGDSIEGGAVANSIRNLGYQYLITAARDDAGNKGLQKAVGEKFTSLGGTTSALSPYSTTQTDFTAFLSALKTNLQSAIAQHGASKVGVYLGSFDECVALFQQASTDPVFSSVRWFGGDGVVLSSALTANAKAAAFAVNTQFFAPNFGLPMSQHPDLARVMSSIKSKSSQDADAYALAAYDAVWVIAKSITAFPSPTPAFQSVLSVFKMEAQRYYGLTGPLQLNAAGDRSNGSFDYWGIGLVNGSYQWKLVGKSS